MKRALAAAGLSLAVHAALLGPLWLLRPPPPPVVGRSGSVLKVDVVSLRAPAAGAEGAALAEARPAAAESSPATGPSAHRAAAVPSPARPAAEEPRAASRESASPAQVASNEAPRPDGASNEVPRPDGAPSPAAGAATAPASATPAGGEGVGAPAPGGSGAGAAALAPAARAPGGSAAALDPGVEAALHQRLQAGAARCYPSASRRFHETGTSEVAFCVGAEGRLTPSRVARSSGSERLDRAALDCVVGGSEPFPQAQGRCFALPVRFGD